ncbi:MAG: tetraacyldisaccharide 4'-kinase [Elusimicrobiota bacterium]
MNAEKIRNFLRKYDLGNLLLIFLSMIYFFAIWTRKCLYRCAILRSRRFKTRIICFGNISSGGTGKTSAVIEAAKLISTRGKKTAIIMRGYGRTKNSRETVILNKSSSSDISFSGDEAMVIKDSLKEYEVPVLVNPRRVEAASKAEELFSPDLILMDDGFQHFAIERDLDFLLINAREAMRDSLLPYGNLREPYSAIRRADAVILTHCENSNQQGLSAIEGEIKKINSDCPILRSRHVFEKIYRPADKKVISLSELQNEKFSAFSSIGDPDSFEKNITENGIKLARTLRYPDHHPFSEEDLKNLSNICHDTQILTTYKDFVRLPDIWKELLGKKLHIFSIRLSFDGQDSERFISILGL